MTYVAFLKHAIQATHIFDYNKILEVLFAKGKLL